MNTSTYRFDLTDNLSQGRADTIPSGPPCVETGYAYVCTTVPQSTDIDTILDEEWEISVVSAAQERYVGQTLIDGQLCHVWYSVDDNAYIAQSSAQQCGECDECT
jgi:hypothetical protein